MDAKHQPVLTEEVLHFLAPERGGWFVDGTVGLGGHAAALLERTPDACLIGIDRDQQALDLAAERLRPFGSRVVLLCGTFSDLATLVKGQGIDKVRGILVDLGVSSLQLAVAARGFSFQLDGPLDMRMGSSELTALEMVNNYPEEALTRIIRENGEERQARRIARAIVERRRQSPLQTTGELRRLIESIKILPAGHRQRRIHPATQTFQALRIEVNEELDQLRSLLDQSVQMLEKEGHLVVISYHSLEDRITKHTLRHLAVGEIEPITGRPRSETQVIEVLTRKPVRPSEAETTANPRARSARLRAARRL